MTAKEVLARRDQLQAEIRHAHAAEQEARRNLVTAEREADDANNARMQMYRERARSGEASLSAAQMAGRESRWEDAEALKKSYERQRIAARQGMVAAQIELQNHLHAHLDVFEEEAEVATQAALAALHEALPALHRARGEWAKAQAAWAPLKEPLEESLRAEREADGTWVDQALIRHLAAVPEWVANEPDFFANMPAPRPRGLTPTPEVEVIEG